MIANKRNQFFGLILDQLYSCLKSELDFNKDENCGTDKNIQCDLQKNEIEKLKKELIAHKVELTEKNEEIF